MDFVLTPVNFPKRRQLRQESERERKKNKSLLRPSTVIYSKLRCVHGQIITICYFAIIHIIGILSEYRRTQHRATAGVAGQAKQAGRQADSTKNKRTIIIMCSKGNSVANCPAKACCVRYASLCSSCRRGCPVVRSFVLLLLLGPCYFVCMCAFVTLKSSSQLHAVEEEKTSETTK